VATLEHFHREIAAGTAMIQAGNVEAAIRHCKAALDISPDHVDAYSLQIDILNAKERPEEGLRVTKARLERVPDCRWAHVQEIRLLGSMNRSGLARKARDRTLELFADDPMMVHDAHLMHDATTGRDKAVLRRIKTLRQGGYWGIFDLNMLEQNARANSGHFATLAKLQEDDLKKGLIDGETLGDHAVIRFLQGRLISSRRLASQAMDVDPANSPIYAETRFAATLGLIPLMWPAQFFITATSMLTARFPWFIRIFTNYVFAIISILALGFMLGGISAIPGMPPALAGLITTVFGLANVGWALYVIWAFGSVGRMRTQKRKVGLSDDY
jgi:tetratricopeptide (TPR) repeat protein